MSEVAHNEHSPLKLTIMRALWNCLQEPKSRFEDVLVNPACEDDADDLEAIGIKADAVLDAIAEPNEDMVKGGCLEADPIGALIGYDPEQCRTQEDVAAVYRAMILEGRQRSNRHRSLKNFEPSGSDIGSSS